MKRNIAAAGVIGILSLSACGGGESPGTPAPTVTVTLSPASIAVGQSATLTWSSSNASTCTASGAWTLPQPTSGSIAESPTTAGSYNYTLSCSSSAGGVATASAALTVTPAKLAILTGALSNGVIGTPFNQTIQATGGVAPFAWKVSGTLPHNLSLDPTTTNTVTISGTPDTVAQGVAFTIEVTDSALGMASQLYTVSISLRADSLTLSSPALQFGNQLVGSTSAALMETLTNTATSDMVISSIAIVPIASNAGEFKQTGTTCGASVPAGASCTVSVSFSPAQPGPRSAALAINDDTAGSPQSVALAGIGLGGGPNATLSPVGLVFGIELVGTTSPTRTVAVTNYGGVALNIGSIAASSSFAETDNCVPSLPSGGTCTIRVTFAPGGSGSVTGMLSISDDAAGSPQKVSLVGTGSTMTPLLNGACYACRAIKSSRCPVGAPSKTPVSVPARCGPCQDGMCSATVTVDEARGCAMDGPPWYGHCQAQ